MKLELKSDGVIGAFSQTDLERNLWEPSRSGQALRGIQDSYQTEVQLVLSCSRTLIFPETDTLIKDLLQRDLNWSYIIQKSQLNGVTPLVCHNLLRSYSQYLPSEIFHNLKEFYNSHAQKNLLATMELLRIIRHLESNGVAVLPFKGPLLALQAYGNVSLRQFCDLDILVREKDFRKAIELLLSLEYRLITSASWLQKRNTPISRKKDYSLVSKDGNVRVELHWKFSGGHFNLPLNMRLLWHQLERVEVGGLQVRNLPLAELLLYLTMHASRHGWVRLAWICDIAELIRINEDIDWLAEIERAKLLGSQRNLSLGLYLAYDLVGAALPEEVIQRIERDKIVRQLASEMRGLLFRDMDRTFSISYFHDYHLKVKERFRDRMRLRLHYYYRYIRLAITPTSKDSTLIPLPRSLTLLHYITRPIRLIYGYCASKINKRFHKGS